MHKAFLFILILGIPVYWLNTLSNDTEYIPTGEHRIQRSEFERTLLATLPEGSHIVKIENSEGMRISFVECPDHKYVLAVTPNEILGYQVPKDIPNSIFLNIEELLKDDRVKMIRYNLPSSFDLKTTNVFLREALVIMES